MSPPTIKLIDLKHADVIFFKRRCVGCLVLSKDGKILLQQRGGNWKTFPGCLATFGGGIEKGESPMQALVRELNEELGAVVLPSEVISLGAMTEESTDHQELIYTYFWQDKKGTITGCYEGEIRYYEDSCAALKHPKIMNDVRWLLDLCKEKQWIK